MFVSPASLKVTLAMLHEGAGGKTAEEIRNALRLESPNFREQLQKILDNLGVCSYRYLLLNKLMQIILIF